MKICLRGAGIEVNNNKDDKMQIFFGQQDVDYNNPDKYAFLNWRFDNAFAPYDGKGMMQLVFDNFEMGKAYMSNAALTLCSLIHSQNGNNVADSLIFPILFSIWHGIELWLKSGIGAIYLQEGVQKSIPLGHDLFKLRDVFETELSNINMICAQKYALEDVDNLISEFKRVNAHFDFARYSSDNKGNLQFYNAPFSNKNQWQCAKSDVAEYTVPNTCVDINVLFELFFRIITNFKELIYYLTICLTEGVHATDTGFKQFQVVGKKTDSTIELNELDPIEKIMYLLDCFILS